MDTLEMLAAKDEIRELTARYCHAIVDGDADTIVPLFCDDGVFHSNKLRPEGRDALRTFYAAAVSKKTHKPFVQNHVIEFEDDEHAKGRCSVEIRVWHNNEAHTESGHYFDRYRKVDGQWRFAERQYNRYHSSPWTTGWKKNSTI